MKANATAHASKGTTFMIISGITSGSEMCLTAAGDSPILLPCLESIGAGEGSELWTFEAAGALKTATGAKCVQASGALGPCTGAGWEITESGQLKTGDMCLSQSGSFAGSEDIAAFAPVSATTSSDAAMHGAKMAVDSDTATFWQSAPGDARSQEFVIDFGGERKVASVEIEWEAPAVEYSIELSKSGKDWTPVFATDVNSLFVTDSFLGYATAVKARVVLKKPHPVFGFVNGKAAYGIRRVSVMSPRLSTTVESCTAAALSTDARDKYFLSYVGEGSDPCPSKKLRTAVPSLDAARTALAASTAKLAERVSSIGSCKGSSTSFAAQRGQAARLPTGPAALLEVDTEAAETAVAEKVAAIGAGGDVLGAAKAMAISARTALAQR